MMNPFKRKALLCAEGGDRMTFGKQARTRRTLHKSTKTAFFAALSVSALLAACIPQARSAEVAATPRVRAAAVSTQTYAPPPRRAPAPAVPATVLTAQRILDSRLEPLGRSFNGDIAMPVRAIQPGQTSQSTRNSNR